MHENNSPDNINTEIPSAWVQPSLCGVNKNNAAHFVAMASQSVQGPFMLVVPDLPTLQHVTEELKWLRPTVPIYSLPGWDVQPYDRLPPHIAVQAKRLEALQAIFKQEKCIVVATVNGVSTKFVPLAELCQPLAFNVGEDYHFSGLKTRLNEMGYQNVSTVMEPGEFSVRGGILDVFPATNADPYRLEFFDETLEHIKAFDPSSQRTQSEAKNILVPQASELILSAERVAQFRTMYRQHFSQGQGDELYATISNNMLEGTAWHYLPLFFKQSLQSVVEVWPQKGKIVALPGVVESMAARQKSIQNAFEMRQKLLTEKTGMEEPYRPIPTELLYINAEDFNQAPIQPIVALDSGENTQNLPYFPLFWHTKSGTPERQKEAMSWIQEVEKNGGKAAFSALSPSSLARLGNMLELANIPHAFAKNWQEIEQAKSGVFITLSPVRWGFKWFKKISAKNADNGGTQPADFLMLCEQDLSGEKQYRPAARRQKAEDVLTHFSELEKGDLVIHQEHGIGKFLGLVTLAPGGEAQDFIELEYSDKDKLFVPITALNVVSRYSAHMEGKRLDKLGSAAWQARKAKVKENLMAMAGELIKTAAERALRTGFVCQPPAELYQAFCDTFPYTPTAEQQAAFSDVEQDLGNSKAMDRLIVGDVGFGKTEVALRAAFIAASSGHQVALLAPTTLLARQHYELFKKRLAPFGLNVVLLSRFVSAKVRKENLKNMANGVVDVAVGTHALLSEQVKFKNLGLMIVDEEHRFGVAHKEKLKHRRANVEMLTISATPIPRTLQMGMNGMTSISMITTPPVDRHSIHSYVSKFDGKVVREAILREIYRGGQVYVVTPRVQDIEKLKENITALVPEAKVRSAHGQTPKETLERLMDDFYEGRFNVLVSTTIVESGLDIPNANTLIINRADRFGLAQLYQLRGRVGRSSVQAYAYFLTPARGEISEEAMKRLQVLQRLSHLGAGFTLASYDLDIRGSGNLLGKQQSGHIKEVGFALYNQLLAEAITEHRQKQGEKVETVDHFTPSLNFGFSYMIPEEYVADEPTRMALYRRLAAQETPEELHVFGDELIDRFGEFPNSVGKLLAVMALQLQCKKVGVERLEAGNRGFSLQFRYNQFAAPENLLKWITEQKGTVSLKPDHRIMIHKAWQTPEQQLKGIEQVLTELEKLLKNEQPDLPK